MFNPDKIVILDFRSSGGSIWRHDFYSRIDAQRFAEPFRQLNRYVGKGIKAEIGVHIYNSVKELPEEYKNEKPIDYYLDGIY